MNKRITRLIGLYELITGGYGTLFLVYSILLAGGGSLSAVMALAFCVFIAVAGARLWEGKPDAGRMSINAQSAQVLALSVRWFSYLLNTGLGFWIDWRSGGLRFHHGISTEFDFGWASGGQRFPFSIGLNLIPLAIIVYLLLAGRKSSGKRR